MRQNNSKKEKYYKNKTKKKGLFNEKKALEFLFHNSSCVEG